MSKNKTRTKDKYRVVYNDTQRIELENEFRLNEYIAIPRKQEIAHKLQLSERQIKIWFQNRRAKKRKQQKRRQTTTTTSSTNAANAPAATNVPSVTALATNSNNNNSNSHRHQSQQQHLHQNQNHSNTNSHNYNHHLHHHHHHQQQQQQHDPNNHSRAVAANHQATTPSEYYSIKVAPCKTETTTITANTTNSSTTTTNGSTANMIAANCYSGPVCATDGQSLEATTNAAKFATLNRQAAPVNINSQMDLEQQHLNRFKTMPNHGHQARPVSSFLPGQMLTGAYQFPGGRGFVQQNNCNLAANQHLPFGQLETNGVEDSFHHSHQHQQLNDSQQQQAYSKFRLNIYNNSQGNYNLCQDGHQKQPEFHHLAEQQAYNDGESINLALLTQQQQNQRMLSCHLKRLPNHCQPSPYGTNGCNPMQQQQVLELAYGQQNDLSSLMAADCQQLQHQPPLLADPNELTNGNNCNYVHYQANSQPHQLAGAASELGELTAGHQFNGSYNTSSIASGSTSATNSSQGTSSGNSSQAATSNLTNTSADQLISLTTIGAGQGNNNQGGACQTAAAKVNQSAGAEQNSDYALLFPPKWV